MRPDVEDYAELDEDHGGRRARGMTWIVLTVFVVGFGALAYYSYQSGSGNAPHDGEMLIVQADESPIKQAPENPEGEQFANQDKTIYDVISPTAGSVPPVEKLLPETEEPLPAVQPSAIVPASEEVASAPSSGTAPVAKAPATTFVNEKLEEASSAPLAQPEKVIETAKNSDPVGAPTFVNESPVASKKQAVSEKSAPIAKPTAIAKSSEKTKSPALKTMIAVKDTETQSTESANFARDDVAPPQRNGNYQVQLGAFKTEAEAQAAWAHAVKKSEGSLGNHYTVSKAELPNGTFYRLRAGGFASAEETKSVCAKLSAQKQPCFPVK